MIIPTFRAVWKQTSYSMDMIDNKCQSLSLLLINMLKYIFFLFQIAGLYFWIYTENQAHYHFMGSYISFLIIVVKISQGK